VLALKLVWCCFSTIKGSEVRLNLSGGLIYVDVHTTNFPNGEIRAQFPGNLFVPDMIIRSLDAGIITRAQAAATDRRI